MRSLLVFVVVLAGTPAFLARGSKAYMASHQTGAYKIRLLTLSGWSAAKAEKTTVPYDQPRRWILDPPRRFRMKSITASAS